MQAESTEHSRSFPTLPFTKSKITWRKLCKTELALNTVKVSSTHQTVKQNPLHRRNQGSEQGRVEKKTCMLHSHCKTCCYNMSVTNTTYNIFISQAVHRSLFFLQVLNTCPSKTLTHATYCLNHRKWTSRAVINDLGVVKYSSFFQF